MLRTIFPAVCAVTLSLVAVAHAQTKPATLPPAAQGDTARQPAATALDAEVERARQLYLAQDYPAALSIVVPAAEAGHPVAMNILGDAHDSGAGVEQDFELALHWWERATEAGDQRAPMNLGNLLRDGRPGIDRDPAAARAAFQIAIDRDYTPALASLGWLLHFGHGGPADPGRALELYAQGQDAGDRYAFEYAAHLYLDGVGVEHDEAQARALFEIAAGMGLAQSQNNLGVMLRDGLGGEVDLPRAEQLLRDSMAQDYTLAVLNLSELLGFHADPRRLSEAQDLCQLARSRDPVLSERWRPDCETIAKYLREGR